MKRIGTSEKYQNNNLKGLIVYSKFLGPSVSFYEIKNKSQVISFLDTKIKNSEDDPDKRWITTWNGIMRLSEALTRIEERLSAIVNYPSNKTFNAEYNPSNIKIPNKDDWIITLWHLHRDSYEEYSGEKFQCCWKMAKNLFIRIYSKELKLNRTKKNIIRLEIQENPDTLFKNLLVEFIRNDNYQRLIELLV